MDAIKNAYYRSFQAVFNVAARCLYWRKPITVEGEGALSKAPELFKKNHVKKVMIVTGRTVGKTIAPLRRPLWTRPASPTSTTPRFPQTRRLQS